MNRATPPEIKPFQNFSLIIPVQQTQSNGVQAFYFQDDNLELIHFHIRIKAGSLFEYQKYLAYATFHLLKESSAQYPASKLDEWLDFTGASWNTTVNFEYAILQLVIPESKVETVFPVLMDAILHPVFTEESLQLFKDQKINDLEYRTLRSDYRANQLMSKALFEKSPAANILEVSDIQNITLESLRKYHQEAICAENFRLFVAGNISDTMCNFINRNLELIQKGSSILKIVQLSDRNPQLWYEERPDSLQSSVIFAKKMFAYQDENRVPFLFLTTLLGGYFGSRLMNKIREEKGYTYGIQAYSTFFADESIFLIKSDINVASTKAAINDCNEEMINIFKNGIDDEEFETVRNYMLGAYLRGVDGVTSLMNAFALWNSFGKVQDNYFEEVNQIQKNTVLELANQYLQPQSFHNIIVGVNK